MTIDINARQHSPSTGRFEPMPGRHEQVGVHLTSSPGMSREMTTLFVASKLARANNHAGRQGEGAWARAQFEGRSAADIDIAERLADYAEGGGVTGDQVRELADHAFGEALEAHAAASAAKALEADSPAYWKHAGARDAYARSYGSLSLLSIHDEHAAKVADRLVEALADGESDPAELFDRAWDVRYPFNDEED